jgi:hypothetical protein
MVVVFLGFFCSIIELQVEGMNVFIAKLYVS